jgi:hypothetical protein
MKAMTFEGPGRKSGTDLHILKGDVPQASPGRVLGHLIDGVQAELARIPAPDVLKIPRSPARARGPRAQD